jgi:predicted permease
MKESLVLGLLGGLVGLPLAVAGLRVLLNMAPDQLPRLAEVALSPAVYLFTLGVSLAAGLFFGVFPALRQARTSPVEALKQGGHGGMAGKGRNRAQNALAVSQMALALFLLVASGLMLRSFQELQNVDSGFHNPEDVLALRINIPFSEVEDRAEMALTHERIARGIGDLAGVESVGLANTIAMDGWNNVNPFYVDGVEPPGGGTPPSRRHNWVGEGYFETMQVPVLAGRTITWEDIHNRAPVAILSESLAREYFDSPQEAIGHRVAAQPNPPHWHEIVGVVADVREDGVDTDPPLLVYWPQVTLAFWEGNDPDAIQTWRYMGYAIRSSRVGTPDFYEEIRGVVASMNPNLPLRQMRPLTELMAGSIARTSFTMVLLATAAGVALILGLVGVYGVISYAVSQRGRELGMRMALGAEPKHVKGMVLGQGLMIFVVGAAVGLGLATALTRLMAGLLFGVEPVDPATFALVPFGLLVVALLASYLPARRAARVDLMEALRRE